MPDADIERALCELERAERALVQLYREFIAEIRSARVELEDEMRRLRAITNAIKAERDLGMPLQ
jgi:hypothetical protein